MTALIRARTTLAASDVSIHAHSAKARHSDALAKVLALHLDSERISSGDGFSSSHQFDRPVFLLEERL